jgi:hypothetical protein
VKKSANNTPRQQDDQTLQEDLLPQSKIESDDTSEDEEQEKQINQLIETLIPTFIDEAIDHGKKIENIKNSMTKAASEWMSDEDLTDEETNRQILITHEEDVE